MIEKIEVTIDVIIHATEDISKIFESFEDMFGLNNEEFSIRHTVGHFDNPIVMLHAKLVKKKAVEFVKRLTEMLSKDQLGEMINEIEERTVDSRYHIRIDKQELIKGNIEFKEKDAIKLKIHTSIYNKKDTVKIFSKIFQNSN